MSYALLGNIAFDLLNAPTAFDERRSATFAEHQVLEGKPKLQAMGLALTELTLELSLHHQLGAVESRYQQLIAAKEKQEALALVLGASKFKGHFVITALDSRTQFTDEQGNALARDVSLTLREFVGNTQAGRLGEALAMGGHSPLASLVPKGLVSGLNTISNAVKKGVEAYRHTQRVIGEVKNAVAVMKAFKNDPATALLQLPMIVENLGGALGGLSGVVGLKERFTQVAGKVGEIRGYFEELTRLAEPLNEAYGLFKRGLNARDLNGDWFNLGEQAVEQAVELSEHFAKNTAKMTAWIAIRTDTEAENG